MRADRQPHIDGHVFIAGAGLAGLYTALKIAPLPVTVLSPVPLGEGASSAWAQGGIAAAVGEGDTPAAHAADTIRVGGGLVDPEVARIVADEAGARVRDLLALGVPFDRDLAGHYLLSREAAHSASRVVRVAGDLAGAAIMQAVVAAVRATPTITVLEGFELVDLIVDDARVTGLRVMRSDGTLYAIEGTGAVVLATGGIGALYARTTNPPYARGEGMAIAARAGAVIMDSEFVQFHPTGIDCELFPTPLASEALRGEGALLVDGAGKRFMPLIHPDGELAPRDIVARAVHRQLQAGLGAFLDCRTAIGPQFRTKFPTVYGKCIEAGIDPVTEPIPVTPAAHYHMGGVATDLLGRTSVAGLWAVGEVARTGLHGANRLASNSLLEAVVLGHRAATDITGTSRRVDWPTAPARLTAQGIATRGAAAVSGHALARLRTLMLTHAGVERDGPGLATALDGLAAIAREADGDLQLSNIAMAARLVVLGALRRKESRGGHYRRDFPGPDPACAHSAPLFLADVTA